MQKSACLKAVHVHLLCAGLCLAAGGAHAVNINDTYLQTHHGGILHDYYDHADTMPNVAAMFVFDAEEGRMNQNCTGTLLNSRMVLTAAHCLMDIGAPTVSLDTPTNHIRFAPDPKLAATPHDRRMRDMVIHPDYLADDDNDVAVMLLERPVHGLTPVTLAGPDYTAEHGQQVVIVGYGFAGTGTVPGRNSDVDIVELPGYDDARRRIAATQLGAFYPERAVLEAQFRVPGSPDDPNVFLVPGPVPALQGQPEGGDSGGPLFAQTSQGLLQIGTVIGGRGGLYGGSGYATVDFWTYLPAHLDWLKHAVADLSSVQSVSVRAGQGTRAWSDAATWQGEVPQNRFGRLTPTQSWERGRLFSAHLDAPAAVRVDQPVEVDELTVSHEQARLQLSAGQRVDVILDTRLLAGQIQADGRLDSDTLALAGGRLSGAGRVAVREGIQQSGGTLSAGSDAGATLAVVGDLVQGPAARTEVALRGLAPGQFGLLQVEGRYQAHGELSLTAPQTVSPALGGSLAFATATDGVYGGYTTVSSSSSATPAGTRWDVLYGPDRLTAYLTPASYAALGAAGAPDSANRRRVGAALDALRPAAGARMTQASQAQLFQALAPRTAAQLPRDLDQLGGAAYAALMAAAAQDSRYLSGQVSDVLAAQRRGDAASANERRQVWTSVDGRWSRLDGDVDVRSRRYGWSMGAQMRLDNEWTVGAALGYSQSSLRALSGMGEGRLRQGHLSLYAQRSLSGGWFTQWQVDAGMGRMRLSRAVDLLGTSHRASTSVRHLGAAGLVGWASGPATQAHWEVTAGVRYQSLRQGGFDDDRSSSISALKVQGETRHDVSTQLRVGGSVPWQQGSVAWRASGWLGWEHAFGRQDTRMTASLLNASYRQHGQGPGRDRWQAGLSVKADVSARSQLALRVQGELARDWRAGQASLDWRYRF